MARTYFIGMIWLFASVGTAWAADVGHDCAEGADEYIVADTKPAPPAGV